MCGVTGFFGRAGLAADLSATVKRMSDRLAHRGPDDCGEWIDAARGLAIGHRRLAVVDLSPHGHQPMASRSGRFVLAFNGEIYNFRELRALLDGNDANWRGHSDTEVMLAAFERWGVDGALQRFNGMFAFVLWDAREHCLYLARDRFGEKPLYYGMQNGTLLFASELKACASHPAWQGELDRRAADLFMRFNYVPGPHTIYRDMHKLPAGSYLQARRDRGQSLEVGKPIAYWSAQNAALEARRNPLTNLPAAKTTLTQLLTESVTARTVADVPLGAFLSGGIDSSLVVALMQRNASRPTQTFTIGYTDSAVDESGYAAAVAKHLGTEHFCHVVSPNEVRDAIVAIPSVYDEPFADSSQIPTFLVSRMAKTKITVALTGDGGDELFGGYHRYFVGQSTWRRLKHLPRSLRRAAAWALSTPTPAQWSAVLGSVFKLTANSSTGALSGERLHRLAMTLRATSPAEMYAGLMTRHDDRTVLGLTQGRYRSTYDNDEHWPATFTEAEAMMLVDTLGILCDDFLVKVDRASMAVGLETRAPFLDPRLFEFAWRMPVDWRISDRHGKVLLREVLAQYVPRELFDRPKQGFGIPIGKWLRGPLRDWAETLLSEQALRDDGLFDAQYVRRIWAQHLSGAFDRQSYLWSVLVFQQWREQQRNFSSSAAGLS